MIEPLVKTAAAISLLLVNGATEASIFEYVGELPGSVSVSYDFGRAVATDGVTVAVSSLNRDSTLGTPGGAGYVFAPDSGALVNRLGDNTASTADAYGWSIAIHGERTLIGAPRGATQPDTAYLFDHSTGAVVKKLAGDVRSENSFGRSLAMDQGLAIVGSPRERISPTEFGAAYVFNASDGARVLKITSGAAPSSSFGTSVDLDGNVALIGSPSFAGIGAAHTYDVATGAKLHDLIPTDNPIGDDFGFHVAIADGVAIVGAPSHSGSGTEFGAVYLFDVSTGQQTAKLVPSASRKGDGFGRIVAVDHGIAMVGSNSSVYVFDVRTGAEIQTITRPDGLYNGFGSSLAFRDGLAVIGATSQGQGPAAGATYIYRITVPEPHAFLLALAACAPLAARRR